MMFAWAVPVLERVQGHQLGKLPRKNLRVTA